MKALIGGIIGALILGALLLFVSPQRALQASGSFGALNTATEATDPVLVDCGEGRQTLLRPVTAGQRYSQVECVPAPATGLAPALEPAVQTFALGPATQRVVYREQPVTRTRRASSSSTRTTYVRHDGRTWKKSALIIGGSAAGGAGLGAIVDGKSGAKKGAVIGGIGGLVYDLATRNK